MNKIVILSYYILFCKEVFVTVECGKGNVEQDTLLVPVASAIPVSDCDCGIITSMPPSYITVDKLKIPSVELPWMATVIEHSPRKGIRRLCPATLISLSYVITSAHCINGLSKGSLGVKLDYFNGHRDFLQVQRIKIHPKFKNGRDHAIALLKLQVPSHMRHQLKHACVQLKDEKQNQTSVNNRHVLTKRWQYAYGSMASEGIHFPKHAQVRVSEMSTGNCSQLYPDLLKAKTLCVSLHKDAMFMQKLRNDFFCLNELGEALYRVRLPKDKRSKERKYTLVGMTSADSRCSNLSMPETTSALYKISSYSDWISQNIIDGRRCRF